MRCAECGDALTPANETSAGVCVECLLTANDRETSASEGLADEKGEGQ
jgi:hypothetical protein